MRFFMLIQDGRRLREAALLVEAWFAPPLIPWRQPMKPSMHLSPPAFIAALVFASASYAQSDADAVKAAVDAYHAALVSLDVAKVAPLWAHDGDVMVVNPADGNVSVGWEAVKKSWEGDLSKMSELTLTQSEGPYIQVRGDVAWATGVLIAGAKMKGGGGGSGPLFESDIFERHGGSWLLVSHAAWLPARPGP